MHWILFTTIFAIFSAQPAANIRTADVESRVHALVNGERQSHKLPVLPSNEKLAEVARAHSRDMVRRNFFSHVNPDGQEPRQRTDDAMCPRIVSENLYMTSLYSRVTITNGKESYDWKTPDALGKEIVNGWMNSAGHRENIITSGYAITGIGVAITDDTLYVTQMFCG
jgi:uncharacterized protein YkwD